MVPLPRNIYYFEPLFQFQFKPEEGTLKGSALRVIDFHKKFTREIEIAHIDKKLNLNFPLYEFTCRINAKNDNRVVNR